MKIFPIIAFNHTNNLSRFKRKGKCQMLGGYLQAILIEKRLIYQIQTYLHFGFSIKNFRL